MPSRGTGTLWTADGRDLSYGIDDDLAGEPNADGIRHGALDYPYQRCRRGNVQAFARVEPGDTGADLDFSPLSGASLLERRQSLFLMRRPSPGAERDAPWRVFDGDGELHFGGRNSLRPWPPRGGWELNSRITNPTTHAVLSEDVNPFTIQ